MGFQNVFGHRQKIAFAEISGPPAPVYGPYTIAFSAVVVSRGGVVTNAEKGYLTTFETSLGTDIIEFDRFWIHGLSNNIAARTSFVKPTSTIITAVNSPTFIPNLGYQGNGVTSYLNSNYNARTQGVAYTLNNASGFAYVNTNVIGGAIFGAFDGTNAPAFLYPQFTVNQPVWYINNQAVGSTGVGSSLGFWTVNRFTSTLTRLFKNGAINSTGTVVSNNIPNQDIFLLGYNTGAGVGTPFNGVISASGFGSSNYNQVTLNTALNVLRASLGW